MSIKNICRIPEDFSQDLDNIASRQLLLKLGFIRVEGGNLLFYKTAKGI
jgi:hypothetical protein